MIKNLFVLLFVYLFMLISRKSDNKSIKIMFSSIAMFFLVIVSGFREFFLDSGYIGTDYPSYVSIFNSSLTISSFINIGFKIPILIFKLIGLNYFSLFIFASLIIIPFVYLFVRNNTKYYDLGIYVFIAFGMLFGSYNIVRQWMACAIFLWGFKYIKEKQLYKYIATIVIASSFHISALLLLPTYYILNNKFDFKKRIIIIIIAALTLGNKYLIELFFKATTIINPSYYYRYIINIEQFGDTCNYVVFFVSVFFLLLILLNINKYKSINKNWNVEINYLLMLVLFGFLGPQHIIFHRMMPYFLPSLLIVVPNSVDIFNTKWKKRYYIFLLVLFLISYF